MFPWERVTSRSTRQNPGNRLVVRELRPAGQPAPVTTPSDGSQISFIVLKLVADEGG